MCAIFFGPDYPDCRQVPDAAAIDLALNPHRLAQVTVLVGAIINRGKRALKL